MSEPKENTDIVIWREVSDRFVHSSIHVTENRGIGIDVGGHVFVKPIEEWHALALEELNRGESAAEQQIEIHPGVFVDPSKERKITLNDETDGTDCDAEQQQSVTYEKIAEILKGIDKDEREPDGWWPIMGGGARWGAEKLAEIKNIFALQVSAAVPPKCDKRHNEAYQSGWNACREAMLAAAPDSTIEQQQQEPVGFLDKYGDFHLHSAGSDKLRPVYIRQQPQVQGDVSDEIVIAALKAFSDGRPENTARRQGKTFAAMRAALKAVWPRAAVPDGWREVLNRAYESVGAGAHAEAAAYERQIVHPHIDGIIDELEALEAALAQPGEGE